MSRFARTILLIGVPLIGASCARAQNEPAHQSAADVLVKSSVREVLLDVVVRSKHGKPVSDLKPEQITVYEDGILQKIRSFRLVKGSEVRVEDQEETADANAQNAGPTPVSKRGINPLRTVNLVCLVFSDLSAETRDLALQAGTDFVTNELRPNTYIGVFSLDDIGLKLLSPFSNDRQHLLKAVELAAMNQLRPIGGSASAGVAAAITAFTLASPNGFGASSDEVARAMINSAGEARSGAAGVEADATNPLGPRGSMESDALSGMRELDSLVSLVRQLSPLPFQKTVLLLGTGLTRPADQTGHWRSLIRAANQGGVTFYGVDVYGLNVCQDSQSTGCLTSHSELQPAVDALDKTAGLAESQAAPGEKLRDSALSSLSGQSAAAQNMETMKQDDYLRYTVLSANKQAALRDLVESTGGFLIANTNNTGQLMKFVMEDVDTHYEVTYQPAVTGYDGHFRKVEVKLARADLQVRTRSGYFSLPEARDSKLDAGDMAGLRALDANPRPHAFDYQAQALRFASHDGTSQYAVVFNVPIANLTAVPEPEANKHRYHVSLLAVARNAQGQVEDWFSRDVPSDVADKYVPALQGRHVTWEHSFHLAPGHYSIQTAVVDEEGNRVSTEVLPVDSPATAGPDISDIMLAQEVKDLARSTDDSDPFEAEGRRVIPLASGALPAGANPYLYFVLYPQKDNPGKTRVRVLVLRDGQLIASRTEAVEQMDASGVVPMLVSAVQKPGNYEVRVAMTQGRASVARSLSYSIAGN